MGLLRLTFLTFHIHDTQNAEFSFHPAKKNLTVGRKSFSCTDCQVWSMLPKDAQASSF